MEEKGYDVSSGYMGWINGRYKLYSSEGDYLEEVREQED